MTLAESDFSQMNTRVSRARSSLIVIALFCRAPLGSGVGLSLIGRTTIQLIYLETSSDSSFRDILRPTENCSICLISDLAEISRFSLLP